MLKRQPFLPLLCALACSSGAGAQSHDECVSSPDWGIFITDFGYADRMVDLRTLPNLNLRGREYLSGEWGHAVRYVKASVMQGPTWLEPNWIFPDWTSNSNFSVTSPIAATGGTNSSGFAIYESVIGNGDLEITITSEVIDTTTGIQQGRSAASETIPSMAPNTSGRYLLSQTYTYKNVSGQTLDNIAIYQLLHSLSALVGVYDDRVHPGVDTAAGPFNYDADYHYDGTIIGKDTEDGSFIDPSPCLPQPVPLEAPHEYVFHIDTLSMHSQQAPTAIDNGYFGSRALGDDHAPPFPLQPFNGIHLAIENDTLANTELFDPGDQDYPSDFPLPSPSTFGDTHLDDYWVATAQQHALGALNDGQSVAFTYLLSLKTETIDLRPLSINIPIPAAALFLLAALFTLIQRKHR